MPSRDKYTDPELREEVKEESQKNVDKWTEEDWQTKEGSGSAKKKDGTEKRYLAEKAWEQMSEKEKEESTSKNATDCTQHWEDEEHQKNGQAEYRKFQEAQKKSERSFESDDSGGQTQDQGEDMSKKRGLGANQARPSKKANNGGSSDGPRGVAGDKTRVPKKGQEVQWHSVPGYVDGTVVEVVYSEKKVLGKSVKGSKEDPRVVLKSSSSDQIAVHKPEAVYFD
ncbi:hypothetical protein P280DRAFT_409927 [Massarina eburnea CBS 473.64]|uniref:Hypervirulence associated protein TUDOR domain-containing protein n=1 Tax=Massarina eburnea CBS 473.64 TaxID=1395130 RepID=A0A6A6RNI8_9PLEO|nr:hypothetical protein P280DRAFT_409927 [Massarina eburnea CBS 473.64]